MFYFEICYGNLTSIFYLYFSQKPWSWLLTPDSWLLRDKCVYSNHHDQTFDKYLTDIIGNLAHLYEWQSFKCFLYSLFPSLEINVYSNHHDQTFDFFLNDIYLRDIIGDLPHLYEWQPFKRFLYGLFPSLMNHNQTFDSFLNDIYLGSHLRYQ